MPTHQSGDSCPRRPPGEIRCRRGRAGRDPPPLGALTRPAGAGGQGIFALRTGCRSNRP